MNSLYGNISNDARTFLPFDTIYSSRYEMDQMALNSHSYEKIELTEDEFNQYIENNTPIYVFNYNTDGSYSQVKTWTNNTNYFIYVGDSDEYHGDGIYVGRYVLVRYSNDTPYGRNSYYEARKVENVSGSNYYAYTSTGNKINKIQANSLYKQTVVIRSTFEDVDRFYKYTGNGDFLEYAYFTPVTDDQDEYIRNYRIDQQVYDGACYDSTIWKKIYSDGVEKYIYIASLNTQVPTFSVSADAPTAVPIAPHFGTDSTNNNYNLHVQVPWGFRIEKATDGPHDEKATAIYLDKANSDPTIGKYTYLEDTYDASIYYNKKGFDIATSTHSSDKYKGITSEFSIKPVDGAQSYDSSGKLIEEYNHDEERDTQQMRIMLPALGDAVATVYDMMYGDGSDNINSDGEKVRHRDVSWVDAHDNNYDDNVESGNSALGGRTRDLETLAGTINYTHDLMGMIVVDMTSYGDHTSITEDMLDSYHPYNENYIAGDFSTDHIYKFNDGYFFKYKNSVLVPIDDPSVLYVETSTNEAIFNQYLLNGTSTKFYIKNEDETFSQAKTWDSSVQYYIEVSDGYQYEELTDYEKEYIELEYQPGYYCIRVSKAASVTQQQFTNSLNNGTSNKYYIIKDGRYIPATTWNSDIVYYEVDNDEGAYVACWDEAYDSSKTYYKKIFTCGYTPVELSDFIPSQLYTESTNKNGEDTFTRADNEDSNAPYDNTETYFEITKEQAVNINHYYEVNRFYTKVSDETNPSSALDSYDIYISCNTDDDKTDSLLNSSKTQLAKNYYLLPTASVTASATEQSKANFIQYYKANTDISSLEYNKTVVWFYVDKFIAVDMSTLTENNYVENTYYMTTESTSLSSYYLISKSTFKTALSKYKTEGKAYQIYKINPNYRSYWYQNNYSDDDTVIKALKAAKDVETVRKILVEIIDSSSLSTVAKANAWYYFNNGGSGAYAQTEGGFDDTDPNNPIYTSPDVQYFFNLNKLSDYRINLIIIPDEPSATTLAKDESSLKGDEALSVNYWKNSNIEKYYWKIPNKINNRTVYRVVRRSDLTDSTYYNSSTNSFKYDIVKMSAAPTAIKDEVFYKDNTYYYHPNNNTKIYSKKKIEAGKKFDEINDAGVYYTYNVSYQTLFEKTKKSFYYADTYYYLEDTSNDIKANQELINLTIQVPNKPSPLSTDTKWYYNDGTYYYDYNVPYADYIESVVYDTTNGISYKIENGDIVFYTKESKAIEDFSAKVTYQNGSYLEWRKDFHDDVTYLKVDINEETFNKYLESGKSTRYYTYDESSGLYNTATAWDEDTQYYLKRTYWIKQDYYIYDNGGIDSFTEGAKWNSASTFVPAAVEIGTQDEEWILKELGGTDKKNFATLYGLILELNRILATDDNTTRDTSTVQGCINKLNDLIGQFDELDPNALLATNSFGQITASYPRGDGWIRSELTDNGSYTYLQLTHGFPHDDIVYNDKATSSLVYNEPVAGEELQTYEFNGNQIRYDDRGHISHVEPNFQNIPIATKTETLAFLNSDCVFLDKVNIQNDITSIQINKQ